MNSSITKEQCDCLRLYNFKGDRIINAYLQNNRNINDDIVSFYKANNKYFSNFSNFYGTTNISDFISKFYQDLLSLVLYESKSDVVYYRGLPTLFRCIDRPCIENDIYISSQFLSISSDKEIAMSFADNDESELEMSLLHITIPAGFKIIQMVYECTSKKFIDEYEYIIPPYVALKINKIEKQPINRYGTLYNYYITLVAKDDKLISSAKSVIESI